MEALAPCFARLQVIDDPVPRPGPLNMALDEALLGSLDGVPVLRLYGWARPTVSLGYFEPAAAARLVAGGGEIVRRWTGGGIVEHGGDQTYALAVPRSCPFATLGSAESYRRVHAALVWALARAGFAAQGHEDAPAAGRGTGGGSVCFERPVLHDLIVDGRKAAGAAQRRNRVGLLHQGSIRLPGADPDARRRWQACLRRELPRCLADTCENRALSPQEIARAQALAVAKYGAAVWTDKF